MAQEDKEMMQNFLRNRTVQVDIYSECKYTASAEVFENQKEVIYHDAIGFEVVSGDEAEKIEAETDGTCIDDFHEYLVIYFEDGETTTFRNSYVDMFVI